MTTETDDETSKPEPMFTRGQMAREVARQVREKVTAALAEYGDLDELKAKAAQADKNQTQLDRIEQQLAEQIKRADAAERETLVRSVADELGIPLRLAKRLEGKTRAELLADGRETMDDLGIKPKGKTAGEPGPGDGDVGGDGNGSQDDQQQEQDDEPPAAPEPARRQRPRERLQSGAPRTPTQPDETDPMKLAALIPRR